MAIVNSRPLAVEALESPDGPCPLTPNHILTMKPEVVLPPPGVFGDADLYTRRRWRPDEFWQRWRREYLALLQTRRVWQRPKSNLQVGDVVVIHDQNERRADWLLGRVSEVMPGADGLVRKVKVTVVASLNAHGRPVGVVGTLERPIHKLTVLVGVDD